jgi:CPA2 family monovalent cation:H+ antiporter-2
MGFLISLSSTAIVLKTLQDRAEMESPQGRISLGILIFQDVIVVLFIILTPFLAGQAGGEGGPPVLRLAITGVVLLLFVLIGSRYLVPVILHQIIRTRSRELFLLTVSGICFAVAYVAAELSLALGAFLAGLTISESEYSHEAFELIRPFRDIFTSFFFVSIGMLLDLGYVLQQPLLILLITIGVLAGKSVIVAVASLLLGYPLRTAMISGLTLSQVGEFAFILATVGSSYALLPPGAEQMFLAVSVLTMAGTSFLIAGAPHVADWVLRGPVPARLQEGLFPNKDLTPLPADDLENHLVIIGFGINGRNVAHAAKFAKIPYAIIEMNADTVCSERQNGELIYYGDATREAVLKQVNLSQACTVVIAIADAAATRRITRLVRQFNSIAYILARTRFVGEMEALYRLGANEVIPEEFETSVEIFARVMEKFEVPEDEISRLVAEVREDSYKMFRSYSPTVG